MFRKIAVPSFSGSNNPKFFFELHGDEDEDVTSTTLSATQHRIAEDP
jgi:hypothetical protein